MRRIKQTVWRWIGAGLGVLLFTQLAGCEKAVEPAASDEMAAYAHTLGLTAAQRQEDFEVFERELREGYPCWGLLEREGVDYEAIFDEYREMVAQDDSDFSLMSAVYSAIWRLGGEGHLQMIEPDQYEDFQSGYEGDETRALWHETVNNPVSRENYPKMLEMWEEDSGAEGSEGIAETPDNVTTLIIEEGKIAYLKIDSFYGTYEADRERVTAFLDEVRGYEHLIIDITQNSGGSDYYWMDLLAAPLANEKLSGTNYALVRCGEMVAKYLQNEYPGDELHPIDGLPKLPKLEARDREIATHYVENTLTVEPTGDGFGGKIWLLVGERVYSAAEAFTVFCKDTVFATIVGAPTGGDGIGIDPVIFALPNSGILVRYSALFGLNADGTSNEEYGTLPDIQSPEGESALVTALRVIRG